MEDTRNCFTTISMSSFTHIGRSVNVKLQKIVMEAIKAIVFPGIRQSGADLRFKSPNPFRI